MPHKVTYRDKARVIQVVTYGRVTVTDLGQALQNVLALYLENKVRNILVLPRKNAKLPPISDVFEFGSTLARIAPSLRFGIVTNRKTVKDIDSLETVADNRGATVRIFDSEESALEWLKSTPDA